MSGHAWHRTAPGEYVTRIGALELRTFRKAGAWHGTINGAPATGWGYPLREQATRVVEAYAFSNAQRGAA